MNFKMHSLHDAFAEIQKYCTSHNLSKEVCYNINLVCEELVVNLLKYTHTPGFNLELSGTETTTKVVLTYQADKFDPTKTAGIKDERLEDRQYGGLGLVLVNALASKIDYQFNEKQSLNVIQIIL